MPYPGEVNFLRRSRPDTQSEGDTDTEERESVTVGDAPGRTAGKGRPTPSRRDAQGKRRGPVAPPPKTQREALKRSKQLRGTKDERRQRSADRRARMLAGDDAVLPARDRGPIRAYVRDLVDSRPHLMGLFMPLAIVIFVTVVVPIPGVQRLGGYFCMVMFAAMLIEGLLLARQIIGRVRTKFPDERVQPLSLGWYGVTRATQVRKFRLPAPRVARGTDVT